LDELIGVVAIKKRKIAEGADQRVPDEKEKWSRAGFGLGRKGRGMNTQIQFKKCVRPAELERTTQSKITDIDVYRRATP